MKKLRQLFCKHHYTLVGSYDVFKDIMVYTNTYQYSYDLLVCCDCGKEKQKKFLNPSLTNLK